MGAMAKQLHEGARVKVHQSVMYTLSWFYQPPTWQEIGKWTAGIIVVAVAVRLLKRWISNRTPKEEAIKITGKVWQSLDAVICIIAAPMVLKSGFHGVTFAVQAMRFWASYARSLLTGFSLLADVLGEEKDTSVAFVKAAEKAASDVVERTSSSEMEAKQRALLKLSPEEFEEYKQSQQKSITSLFDEVDAKAAQSGLEIEMEQARVDHKRRYWIVALCVLLTVLIASIAYVYWISDKKEEPKEEHNTKKQKRRLKNTNDEYDSDGRKKPHEYNSHEEARKPVCPVWQQNRGKCKPDGSICDEFYHPKEWKQPCENRQCPGTAKCGKPHVARRKPVAAKAQPKEEVAVVSSVQEEARLAEPLVPLTRAMGALAKVTCIYRGKDVSETDGVLLFGRMWVPYHLWRDVKVDEKEEAMPHFRVNWLDGTETEILAFKEVVRVGNLDLSWLPIKVPAGKKSMVPGELRVGAKLTTLAMRGKEVETSTGYLTSVTPYLATHSVTTDFGHCCCALLNEHGHMVGFHILGSSAEGTFIPLTPEVIGLMMSKN